MLRQKLKRMVDRHGKAKVREMINDKLKQLALNMRQASNIYHAIDIEHEIMDQEAMLKWLKDV